MPAEVRLVFDGAKMDELLHGPSGMVNDFMFTHGEIVRQAAIQDVNVGKGPTAGNLKRSIRKRIEYVGTEISVRIIAGGENDVTYAYYVHEGTAPHIIKAKNKPFLVFFWPNAPGGGRWVRAKQINHPGYKGNPFLSRNLGLFFAI